MKDEPKGKIESHRLEVAFLRDSHIKENKTGTHVWKDYGSKNTSFNTQMRPFLFNEAKRVSDNALKRGEKLLKTHRKEL